MNGQGLVIELGGAGRAFAKGGNRYCFVHPARRDRCIKVLRQDRSPSLKRRQRGFPRNLKSLSTYDDNRQELRVYDAIDQTIGEAAYELVPRCHGMVRTDLGPGLCTGLIRDDDGRVSVTLKQYLWQHGETDALGSAVDDFATAWQALGMPSRNLLVHNIVVQCREGLPRRLWAIDGLGWPDFLPLAYWFRPLARRKAAKRIVRLRRAMAGVLEKKAENRDYGYHGWLEAEDRQV